MLLNINSGKDSSISIFFNLWPLSKISILPLIFLFIFSCARNEDEFKDYNVGTSDGLNLKSGGFVAVGNSGTILTSSDGTSWTSRTSGTTNKLNAVTYSQ